MSVLVAKRYVKALISEAELSDLAQVNEQLKTIATAFANDKFLQIVSSTDVATDKKVDLILSFVENNNNKVKNLILLLGNNKRLDQIPDISAELNNQLAVLNNNYEGVVYSNSSLSDNYISDIENQFSKKFNITLKLTNEVCDYDGIKVDIDGLGIEIGFSKEQLKQQMINHILKAV